jgi:hypothetical protein
VAFSPDLTKLFVATIGDVFEGIPVFQVVPLRYPPNLVQPLGRILVPSGVSMTSMPMAASSSRSRSEVA